ncbi:MAG: prealbumin-like fold domain-containing protein [Lachnospiraceae bacterium]
MTFSVQKVLAADEAENLSEAVLVTTADGGKIETKYVTAGTYVIRGVSTLPGYLLDTKERYFTVDEEGFIFESDSEGRPLDEDCAKSDTGDAEMDQRLYEMGYFQNRYHRGSGTGRSRA